MFGAHTFGGLILGVAVAVAPLAQPIPGTDGGGFGTTYFGQYAPGVAVAPPLPPTPPPPPEPTPGGGGGRAFYALPQRHHAAGDLIQSPQVLAGRARVIPYALTVRARNARLLALLD
jgi:hypothetical protein